MTGDAGPSWLMTGLCRRLARRGVSVASFKARIMSLHAAVNADGGEIGNARR